jgi:hypothetical protein
MWAAVLAREQEAKGGENPDRLPERIIPSRKAIIMTVKESFHNKNVPEPAGEARRDCGDADHVPRPQALQALYESIEEFDELYRRLAE